MFKYYKYKTETMHHLNGSICTLTTFISGERSCTTAEGLQNEVQSLGLIDIFMQSGSSCDYIKRQVQEHKQRHAFTTD